MNHNMGHLHLVRYDHTILPNNTLMVHVAEGATTIKRHSGEVYAHLSGTHDATGLGDFPHYPREGNVEDTRVLVAASPRYLHLHNVSPAVDARVTVWFTKMPKIRASDEVVVYSDEGVAA